MLYPILNRFRLCRWLILVCIPLITSCSSNKQAPQKFQPEANIPPIRFLLTFDDGPSGKSRNNPTQKILEVLANNPYQPNIKAIFFTQTRAARGGGTDIGQALLQRENEEGHLLAFHSATKHHDNHRFLAPEELDLSLQAGIQDLTKITGRAPRLVRPPFWSFNSSTFSIYQRHGLEILLTDLSANDGKIYGVNWSWHKRSNMLKQLARAKQQVIEGGIPVVDGTIPIVVTFHDVNSYTARNMEVYLGILLDVAKELDLPLAAKPFYDDRAQLEKAALARRVQDAKGGDYIPGFWGLWWKLR